LDGGTGVFLFCHSLISPFEKLYHKNLRMSQDNDTILWSSEKENQVSTELSVVQRLSGEILGPESAFAVARSEKRKEWEVVVLAAKDFQVTDAESKETAVGYGRLLQASTKALNELYTSTKQGIDAIKKPILEAEKSDIGAITAAKDALGSKVLAYDREQARILAEAQRKAQEEARQAEIERKLQEAIALEAAGEKEESAQVLDEPIMAVPAIVQEAPTKVTGQVTKTTYSAVVTDFKKLVMAVSRGEVPLLALKADEPWLNGQARAFRTGLSYPGVEVKENTGTHFRS
jgi:hypothetical protein